MLTRIGLPRATVRLFALLLGLEALAMGGSLGAQQVTLARKYTAGEEHVFRTTVSSSSATGMGNIGMSQTSVTREKVVSVTPAGTVTLSSTLESFQMKRDVPMMASIEYDSRTDPPPTDRSAARTAARIGKTTTATFNPRGGITSMSALPDSAADSMIREITSNMTAEGSELPDHPVAVGDSWTAAIATDVARVGGISSQRVFTLEKIVTENGHRIAKITVSGTQGLTPGADSPMTMVGATMSPGQMTGEIDFDIDLGLEIRRVTTTTLTIAIAAMGQSMTSESRIEKVLVP